MLTPEIQSEMLALYFAEKKSVRSIALQFGVARATVRKVLKRRQVNLSIQTGKKGSILDPYKPYILELLKKDPEIKCPAILNQIRDQGYMGGITIL